MSALVQVMADFHFLRPWWLLALIALPGLWWLWRRRQQRANAWRGLVDQHLLVHMQVGGGRAQVLGLVGIVLAWVLATLALAGPSWQRSEQPLWQTRAPLVVALDLSGSIAANDLPPSRLLQARAKLATLLRERVGGQVALVAYAGEPFTVAPLTDDAANVALFLDALDPAIMPVDGSDARRAILWSEELLQRAGFDRGQILLLTDHADPAADSAAKRARDAGFSVSVLGLGTPAGAAYRQADGQFGRAQLDAASLQRLATAGGGRFEVLRTDDADLRALGVLDPQAEDASAARGEKGSAWLDQGYWLLPALMLLVLLAFRRGGVLAALALCVVLPMAQPAQAMDWWKRADQQAQDRIEQGAKAYRGGDYAAATKDFAGLASADGLYNLGNALAKQGKYDEAIAAYDKALQRQPGMEDAIANRAAVEAARKRQPPAGGQGGQGGDQGKQPPEQKSGQQQSSGGKQDDKPGQDQQDSQQQDKQQQGKQQDKQDADKGAKNSSGDAKSEPPKSASEQQREQQAADAAQRERMQQAMQQQAGQGAQPEPTQAKPETAAEREQRQATEAWLRRVPDDPGGLLRAKFQLEYQRRQREGQ
ncbi:VWA domain-containing protein [Pseudoxanthomonas sp. USHLN014]|uniref:vWA domain-containing protein n=1 Tax=Pseudoxanthomonas sp. USHLN014 TaxID=3081297 RepID=UPI00301CD557